jgi:hypothetical protein
MNPSFGAINGTSGATNYNGKGKLSQHVVDNFQNVYYIQALTAGGSSGMRIRGATIRYYTTAPH